MKKRIEQLYSIVAPTRSDDEDIRCQVMVLCGFSMSICIAVFIGFLECFCLSGKTVKYHRTLHSTIGWRGHIRFGQIWLFPLPTTPLVVAQLITTSLVGVSAR
jgi:hypothetical protein